MTTTACPRLKGVVWEREGDQLRILYDIREQFLLSDPDGLVEALLTMLASGGRTPEQLADGLSRDGRDVAVGDVLGALELFDAHGLVEKDHGGALFDVAERERYFSNLAFFESFASLRRSREELQQSLRESHVLVLGTGGLNSNTIPHLCGLGVGRLTLLDRDSVEPRNFARQYLYRHGDIGSPKVQLAADWVRAFDPRIKVEAISADLKDRSQIGELIDQFAPDVVMSGVDSPRGIDDSVNAACVSRAVPYVRGGMHVTTGQVWSVDPGESACWECRYASIDSLGDDDLAASELFKAKERTNRGIGPVAGLLGSLCAFEVLRYLSRFEAPAHAGRLLTIDFAGGCTMQDLPWQRDPTCSVCGPAETTTQERR